jgi:tetraacyldisaccharide 4'-kinase
MTQTLCARPYLLPLVPLYRLALALRAFELRSGLKPIRRLRRPVVSIGNLSTGGAGKTPLTIALAKALTARGLHVDVLSRGYGRRRSMPSLSPPLSVDPSGTAEDFGDEPLLIAREARVPVYVAAQRYQAGLMAEADALERANQRVSVHLLDDGFQHRQLARDVDILLLTSEDLRDHLLPAGNLREPLRSLLRASVLAIPADEPELEAALQALGWQGPFWRLRRTMDVPPVHEAVAGLASDRADSAIVAFCGIARPGQFFAGLESAGLRVASRIAFADHHRYIAHDLDCILDAARTVGATALFTTEKDRVRLGGLAASFPSSLPLKTARLSIEIENEQTALDWLLNRVRSDV